MVTLTKETTNRTHINEWKATGLEWLNPAHLVTEDYQRPLIPKKVDKLVKDFDINKVGAIDVNLRDSMAYYILDGQHRCAAALRLGITSLPCLVYVGLDKPEEAELRRGFSRRNNDTGAETFRLKLAEGDPDAIAIQDIVAGFGLILHLKGRATGRDSQDPKCISCVGSLEYIYTNGGYDMLRRVLSVSLLAWPNDHQGRMGLVYRGLHSFLSKYPEVDMGMLVEKLRMNTPSELCAESRRRMKDGLDVGHQSTHFARVILVQYNKSKRTNRLPNRLG